MARRGSTKELSVRHENYIAHIFGGQRSKSSGASDKDVGDVQANELRIECKMTGNPSNLVSKPVPKFVAQLEKIASEAWERGKEPMLALRYWSPTSVLAGPEGWIDLTVRLASDDAEREQKPEPERQDQNRNRSACANPLR